MSDYYGYGPQKTLSEWVILTGFYGVKITTVANAMAALTGHPVFDLDRLIEHNAGQSLGSLVLLEGKERYEMLETGILKKMMQNDGPGILALGAGTLSISANAAAIADKGHLVYLELPLNALLENIQADWPSKPGNFPPYVREAPKTIADIEPLYREYLSGYQSAGTTVNANRVAHRVARNVIAELGL